MFNLLAQTTMPSTQPSEHGFFYPIQAATIANDVDPLAWFIHIMSIVFTVGIIGVTVYFCWKYRASVHPIPQPPGHNNVLEVVWTAIPAIIVFVCFFWGFRVYMKMTVHQPGSTQIEAIGKQWSWQFQYDNPKGGPKVADTELWMVKDVPVEITMRSEDVIHALYIPTMRMKKDVVPGRFSQMVLEPNRLGVFDVYCAEYCGDSHSTMLAKVHVVDKATYDKKMDELANPLVDPQGNPLPPAEAGLKIVKLNGCFSCHSTDGAAGTGPTWLDLYGATGHELADGSSITVDDNYIVESIRNPNAKVRKGFGPPSAMNPFTKGTIPDEYLPYIIAYQKSISKYAPKQAASAPTSAPADNKAVGPNTQSQKAANGQSNDAQDKK